MSEENKEQVCLLVCGSRERVCVMCVCVSCVIVCVRECDIDDNSCVKDRQGMTGTVRKRKRDVYL